MSTGTRRPTITWVLLPDSNISNLKPKPNRIFQWKCQRIFFILSTFSKSIIIKRWPNHRSPSSFCPGFELHIFPYFYVSTFTGALPWSSSYGGSLLGGRKVKLGGNEICLQTGVRSLRENGGRGVPTIEGSFKKNLFEWEQKFYLKTRKSWKCTRTQNSGVLTICSSSFLTEFPSSSSPPSPASSILFSSAFPPSSSKNRCDS